MEAIKTTTHRIHPLMAAAAASVVVVSLVGTAAITGILPSSNSAPAPQAALVNTQNGMTPAYAAAMGPNGALAAPNLSSQAQPAGYAQAAGYAQPVAYAQPVQGAYAQPAGAMYAQPVAAAAPAPAPVVIKETIIREVPAKHVAPRPHTVVHHTYARNDYYAPAPRPQPNYVGIGTGAVIGGLLGSQVGSGNGRKLATVAGIIGGGMVGNQMINR